jgi:SAM-dependent methyltransferase
MSRYVLSKSVAVNQQDDGQYSVFNGMNVRLNLHEDLVHLLKTFETPQSIGDALRAFSQGAGAQQRRSFLEEMIRFLVLVPAEQNHKTDMRMVWNCLALGSDDDAAFVIDNETKTIEEFAQAGEEAVQALDRLLPLNPLWRVVNIGCGMGRIERPLSARAQRIFAFDVSDLMIERAKKYLTGLSNIELRRTDSKLPGIDDSSIDLVVSFLVFQHCPKEVTWDYFAEAGRVLKTGGQFVFQILCYASMAGYAPSERSPLSRYYGAGKPHYQEDEIRRYLTEAGFTVSMFRDGEHVGVERRLSGTAAPHWASKLVHAIKS